MKIFSQNISLFTQKSLKISKEILEKEMGIRCSTSRFIYKKYSYPLNIEIFENKSEIGYFNFRYYLIGLNKILIYRSKQSVLRDILRHELIHYLAYIEYGPSINPHGDEFKSLCQRFGYSKDSIVSCKMDLEKENEQQVGEIRYEKILTKIQKLMGLARSSNIYEAELATEKANKLLLKYNLEEKDSSHEDDEETCIETVLQSKRTSPKLRAISEILKNFLVYPIFNHGKGEVSLQVIGERVNVMLANHVALFLNQEFERLWKHQQSKTPHLKGALHKNSFFQGIAVGHNNKMEKVTQNFLQSEQQSLILYKKNLRERVDLVFKRLGHRQNQAQTSLTALNLGELAGKNLHINPAIQGSRSSERSGGGHLLPIS